MVDRKTSSTSTPLDLTEHAAQEAAGVDDLIPGFDRVFFQDGDIIFQENDGGDAAYLIVHGRVEVRKGMRAENPLTLARLGRGDIFGELALFDNAPRMGEAMARSKVEAIRISHKEFHNRLGTMDPVMKAIIMYMVKRVRTLSDDVLRRRDPDWSKWSKDA